MKGHKCLQFGCTTWLLPLASEQGGGRCGDHQQDCCCVAHIEDGDCPACETHGNGGLHEVA